LKEQALEKIGLPVTFLRPAWFMENALWDVPSARDEGVLHSFLQPADKVFPMVATQDVGSLAAALLMEDWNETRVVELEGPTRVSPNDLACAFAKVLERPIRVDTVLSESWERIFRSQGAQNPCRESGCLTASMRRRVCRSLQRRSGPRRRARAARPAPKRPDRHRYNGR
jgi:uncharacterized protein YbjT (DUF2867 family)